MMNVIREQGLDRAIGVDLTMHLWPLCLTKDS